MLMRSLFDDMLGLICYRLLEVFSFLGKSSYKVHLMFLPLLQDFKAAGHYS